MRRTMIFAGLTGLAVTAVAGGEPGPDRPPAVQPVRNDDPAAKAESPTARLVVGSRTGGSQTSRTGTSLTSGGVVEITQSRPDTVVATMTGAVGVAGMALEDSLAGIGFDLRQELAVVGARADQPVRLSMEGQVIGYLDGNKVGNGTAATNVPACAVIETGGHPVLRAALEVRAVTGKGHQFVNDQCGPVAAFVPPGVYALHQTFGIEASHPKTCSGHHRNAVLAVFAPEVRFPVWAGTPDSPRPNFGFRVVIHVDPAPPGAPATVPGAGGTAQK